LAFLRALRSAPSGVAALMALLALAAVAVLAPVLLEKTAGAFDFQAVAAPPSLHHPLGTDQLGRDLLARLLVATRLSVGMGVLVEILSYAAGVPLGALTALLGGRSRSVLMRVIDTMIAFPGLLVTIYLVTILGPRLGLFGLAVGLAVPGAFRAARVVSTLALSIAGRDYVAAARVVGVGRGRLVARYLVPNMAETLITSFAVGVSFTIVAFSGLSFLGIGVQPPAYDWGQLLSQGVNSFYETPAAALGPAAFIAGSALAFAFAGEALARAANPRLWATVRSEAELFAEPAEAPAEAAAAEPAPPAAAPAEAGAALSVRGLTVRIAGAEIVSAISFDVAPGEMLGLVGESGSGKTMTALAVSRLLPGGAELEGEVSLLGRRLEVLSPSELARFLGVELAFVFQDPMSSFNPALTLGVQLTEGARRHRGLARSAAAATAVERLQEVNFPAPARVLRQYPHELSGGMRQRAMIAMGLMNGPRLLLCDEPTTALDVTIQAQIMDLLARVNRDHGVAVVLISHNLALVRQSCSRVLVMYAGRIVEDLAADRLLTGARHPYTRSLLAAVPDLERPRGQALASIPGQPPDPFARPAGCPFHPRCPLADDRCRELLPALEDQPGGGRAACWKAGVEVPV
jgi:peptide/nickel transport system ATP-binding protein/peptide/nickel transport system permease protein